MKIEITTTPEFHIPFLTSHLDALIKVSQHHYDDRCKEASSDQGFLARWKRDVQYCIDMKVDVVSTRVSFQELDTCLKILEGRYYLLHGEELALCNELESALFWVVSLANSKYNEWKATYDPLGDNTAAS